VTLEPHHAAARHRTDDEADALAAVAAKIRNRGVLARLRPTVTPDLEARAARTAAHLTGGDDDATT
jgi:hypothetical protein